MRKQSKYAKGGAAYVYSTKYTEWRNKVTTGREAHEEAKTHSVSVGLLLVDASGYDAKWVHGFGYPSVHV